MLQSIDLLGDSILDNSEYVSAGEAVIDLISSRSPIPVNLLAVDGHTTLECLEILENMAPPESVTGAVLSIGGNDALQAALVLDQPVKTVAHAFSKMIPILDKFRENYVQVLENAMRLYGRKNLRICTIYNKVPLGPGISREALAALALFNDVITEEVPRRGLRALDLRVICEAPDSYSAVSPIEPSLEGGRRIVEAILSSFQ